jgi:hypothetical protein
LFLVKLADEGVAAVLAEFDATAERAIEGLAVGGIVALREVQLNVAPNNPQRRTRIRPGFMRALA